PCLHDSLAHLPDAAPAFSSTVLVGRGNPPARADLTVHRSRLHTQNPVARIIWEQIAAPRTLAHLQPDLLHGMAFALPLRWRGPSVVPIYDLSFIRHPKPLTATRRRCRPTPTRRPPCRPRRLSAMSRSRRHALRELRGLPRG